MLPRPDAKSFFLSGEAQWRRDVALFEQGTVRSGQEQIGQMLEEFFDGSDPKQEGHPPLLGL